MSTLIAGRFSQQTQAETASAELLRSGFSPKDMTLFYVNPQGQHGTYPVGGDEDESPGTHEASAGAMRGVAGGVGVGTLVGAATLPILGPAGPLLGAAVGAYTGSLVGALGTMNKSKENAEVVDKAEKEGVPHPEESHPRKAGVLLAVAVSTPEQRQNAIQILGVSALELEEAEGVMRDGQWTDFNPLKPIKAVE